MSLKSVVRFTMLTMLGLSIAACASRNPFEVTVSHCPAVAVMGDMGSFTRIEGDSDLAKDVLYTATIANIQSDCTDNKSVDTQLSFDVSVIAGPAFKGRSVNVEYYVLTVRDTASIVSKKTYSTTITLDSNGRGVKRQVIEHTIPSVDRAREYDYELLVALKATPTEYYRNMK